MINPDAVGTSIVCSALWVYRELWGSRYWVEKTTQLQAAIDGSGLSIPVPVIDLSGDAPEIPKGNPLTQVKPFFKRLAFSGDLDASARRIAQALYRAQLPVFYCDNSQLIDLTLNGQGRAVEDVATYAPVLVYCHNDDRRGEGISRARERLYSRSFGICWLIEQEGL